MRTTNVLGNFADKVCANALTATYLMAGFRSVTCILELGLRGLVDPILTPLIAHMKKGGEEHDSSKRNWVFDKVLNTIEIRGELRNVETSALLKDAARYFVIALVVKEITDRIFGPPIQAFNLIGKFIGVQILPAGCHFPKMAEWRDFLTPMASAAV